MDKNAIYDDNSFFDNYIDLRSKENNYNDLIEQPIVLDLIGNVADKHVLDIGCGYGAMTYTLAKHGAKRVVGIDISKNMIDKATKENLHSNVDYRVMSALDICSLNECFDIVVSCLAIHYIEDIACLFRYVFDRLSPGGSFVFSMEHPMYTASKKEQQWTYDEQGCITGFITDNYGDESVRNICWLGKSVTKYHHKTDTVINSLIDAGFTLDKVVEPSPDKALMESVPRTVHELHRPAYLIIRCHRK